MNHFFHSTDTIVTQAIDGVLRVAGAKNLVRADAFPHTKYVVRGDWDKSKVAIISGGGAGHEPAHVGFVGKGLLTAAVAGEIFSSPSVEAVLSCILEVTGEAGCLLIVKNYTGDRLNFGLAAERAREMGKKVEMVIVADDIALPGAHQPRGIAGTLFVHKVAGCLAEQGESLEIIRFQAERVARNTMSLGFALSTCTLPDQSLPERLIDPELGLGIHGEPGAEKVSLDEDRMAVSMVLERLQEAVESDSCEYALIVNNLGAVTALEMSIITDQVLTSDFGRRVKYIIGPELLMTSLNMYGFSLSVTRLTPEVEAALLAPVEPRAWPPVVQPVEPVLVDVSYQQLRQQFEPSESSLLRHLLGEVCELLIHSERSLNELDASVGDGDTGHTFANAARAVRDALEDKTLPLAQPGALCLSIGQILSNAMGGSSGVLLSIFFTRAGAAINEGLDWVNGLKSGLDKMMEYGGAKPGDRTMLDALIPAVYRLDNADFSCAAILAREGADMTASMMSAKAGRSSYLRADSLDGVIDPGAEAIARVFKKVAEVMDEQSAGRQKAEISG
ncbi:dihydroxyacetone kinase [Hahella sp. CCB-MM4]|uniref:dihydroxyacetone kinase subunit DhaK n=1 Tax=Hahella sp. (strain CCB-MM4) TaxID=1926491 RepID=UPI000B9C1794|nr:dihydroxyacetone kinase subunit DhaK [Hahella sp. CCB-MM4]OZG75434.1 dihydroxyacetone kinase [Hahella sp. CCB-MM4]